MKKPRPDDRGTIAGTGNNCRGATSFRSGPQDRIRNLEIPRCAIAHLRFALRAPRNDERKTYVADAAAGWKTSPKPSMQ